MAQAFFKDVKTPFHKFRIADRAINGAAICRQLAESLLKQDFNANQELKNSNLENKGLIQVGFSLLLKSDS